MLYDKVLNFFIEISNVLYPGEYTNEQLKNIFISNVSRIIKDSSTRYIEFNKTFTVNQLNEFDSDMICTVNKILLASEEFKLSDIDRNQYIKNFVFEFNKLFPNLYSSEELFGIIDNNVKTIVIDPLKNNLYSPVEKKIQLNHEEFDFITFHEFVHSIRGEIYTCFHGIDEGLTDLCAQMYKNKTTNYNSVVPEESTYGYLVKHVIKLCNLKPELLKKYLMREDYGYLFNNTDLIRVIYLMEDLYNLDSLNLIQNEKVKKYNEYNSQIDSYIKK